MKRFNSKKNFFLLLIAGTLLLGACTSARKLAESGKYDEAITRLVSKLQGKRKKDPDKVKLLEYVFAKAQARDFRDIKRLEASNREDSWTAIADIYEQIKRRQDLIEPLTPLSDKNGYIAHFDFVDVVDDAVKADQKARSFLYNDAGRYMDKFNKTHDKYYAREAFFSLDELHRKYGDYKDSRLLQDKAYEAGMDHYYIRITNKSQTVLPASFARALSDVPRRDFEKDWKAIDPVPVKGKDYDYTIVYEINDVEISPDLQKEREYEETKEIEESPSKGLSGPVILKESKDGKKLEAKKIKTLVTVKARILEVYQHKSAWIRGVVRIYRTKDHSIVFTEPLEAEYVFENYASKIISGDKRALSEETKKHLGNHPVPFPSDDEFLYDAAGFMKSRFFAIFRKFNPSTRSNS